MHSDNRLVRSAEAADATAASLLHLDIASNRTAQKYRATEQLLRVLWSVGRFAVALSPRPLFGWRRFVLRLFGAKVGRAVHVYPSAKIYMPWNVEIGDWATIGEDAFIYSLGKVTIGAQATLSYRAHVCAGSHDFRDPAVPLLKPPVVLQAKVWVGTEAFIGPGVTIGEGALVGARAVVVRDVAPAHVVVGNPARSVGLRPVIRPQGARS